MKIIITYASAGIGHRKASEALYNYFKENYKDADATVIDILDKTNFIFKNLYNRGYSFLVGHALWLWRISFWLTSIRILSPFSKTIGFIINLLNTKNSIDFLIRENPDFVIATHFLPAEIYAYVKKTYNLNFKMITVVTDFIVHPFWISPGTDLYITASDITKEQIVREGVRESEIKALGIPIDAKFLQKHERNNLAAGFGLDKDKFTVLVITGSFGIGPLETIVDLLHEEAQLLVVCGNNQRLYQRLKKKDYKRVKIFGFIDNVQELMAVSDMIITKPGGLSIAETLAMEVVPLFISPIPGQETGNIRVLKRYGIGLQIRKINDIKNIVLDFKNHPEKLRDTKESIRKIKKPFAARDICNVVCKDSIKPSG